MNKIEVQNLKTTNGGEIDVYVSYKDGKDGFGRPGREPKGYVLHIQPVKREHQGNIVVTTASGYSGVKGMIEETKRFSQKRFEQVAAEALNTDLYKNGLAQVLDRNGLTIKEEAPQGGSPAMCSVNCPPSPKGRADHLIVTPWEVDRLEFTGLRHLEPTNGTALHLEVFGKHLSGWPHTMKANPEGTSVTFRLEESERAPELKQENQPPNTVCERAWYVQE